VFVDDFDGQCDAPLESSDVFNFKYEILCTVCLLSTVYCLLLCTVCCCVGGLIGGVLVCGESLGLV
jgi:hypothetical protein